MATTYCTTHYVNRLSRYITVCCIHLILYCGWPQETGTIARGYGLGKASRCVHEELWLFPQESPVFLEWKNFTEQWRAKGQCMMLLCWFRGWSPAVVFPWTLGQNPVLIKVTIPEVSLHASSCLSRILNNTWFVNSSNLLMLWYKEGYLPKNRFPGKILYMYFLSWCRGFWFKGQFLIKTGITFLLSWLRSSLVYFTYGSHCQFSWGIIHVFAVSLMEFS